MKVAEIREYPSEELASRLSETKEELFNLRFQHATGQLENYSRLGDVRRDVARIHSVIRERELGIIAEPSPEQAEASRRRRDEAEQAEQAPRKRRGLRRRGAEGEAGAEVDDVAEGSTLTEEKVDEESDDE